MVKNQKIEWFRESRFGLFIHWGLYSLLSRGEWVMWSERIPAKEYQKLASKFNPIKFDADEWVSLAKAAGMKYIVITTKHHDGFAMFDTKVSEYNIVEATPFKRDILKELAERCQREGIKLCFYYSHVVDWNHPLSQNLTQWPYTFGGKLSNYGNYWDYPDENRKNLQKYLDEVTKPHLRELLTKYGEIGIIWFDGEGLISPKQSQSLVDLVHQLQPDCLVNSRVGEASYDYTSLGDNEIPGISVDYDWESAVTICDGWGYNANPDNVYRKPEDLIHQLVEVASLGGNYLLNVGPDSEGVILEDSQSILRNMGEWLQKNGESIYGTTASKFFYKPDWGRITQKENKLYLHIYNWQPEIKLKGLCSSVTEAYFPANNTRHITFNQNFNKTYGYSDLSINLSGEAIDLIDNVLVLEFNEAPKVYKHLIQTDESVINLPSFVADLNLAKDSKLKVNHGGVINNWIYVEDWVSWTFKVEEPGIYEAEIVLKTDWGNDWDLGHIVDFEMNDGQKFNVEISSWVGKKDESMNAEIHGGNIDKSFYENEERSFRVGTIKLSNPEVYTISLKPKKLVSGRRRGLTLLSIVLKK